ncbi:hypothetical protein ISF_05308 [Cordyceps fumosorosea ARSEF 2679]|uniref:Uncharacterized protein n=1 Tax=Cordyceps fumosorosea (strain ARSEF 2679) TaxID=1081104 RepID=A0A167V784_CORFA|nr:hypothetical protein ISF_05308 [Cordyceps fumosorosea ARSEF 2679]OAA62299.1 hypothetical protein ISF_05308 [Cordyceps fumosorosea ARSEF 2679]
MGQLQPDQLQRMVLLLIHHHNVAQVPRACFAARRQRVGTHLPPCLRGKAATTIPTPRKTFPALCRPSTSSTRRSTAPTSAARPGMRTRASSSTRKSTSTSPPSCPSRFSSGFSQCFCGHAIESTAIKADESRCNADCPADPGK